jgi:glycosyltransferase involved in cell wall biosynthesis
MLRAAQACIEMGNTPSVFALHRPGLARREMTRGIQVHRFRLVTRQLSRRKIIQLIKYMEALIRMLWAGFRLRPRVVYANDLPTLPVGSLISRFVGSRLIYDSRELSSDRSDNASFPKWMLKAGLAWERVLARKADSVITVSLSISNEIARRIQISRPIVIRNMPHRNSSRAIVRKNTGSLRKKLGIKGGIPIVLYQGMITEGRGLLTLVEAISRLINLSAVMVFLGNGEWTRELNSKVQTVGLEKRVYFHPAVPPEVLHNWTEDADLGVNPIEGNCDNHRLCLPNKLFEYIQAGLPVVVTDLPEMRRIVTQYGVGEVFRDGDPEDLAAKIDSVLVNGHKYGLASRAAAKELNWDVEKHRLIDVYKSVLTP